MRGLLLAVLIGSGCKQGVPTPVDTDLPTPVDTDVPTPADTDPPPIEDVPLADLDAAQAASVCASLDAPSTVPCDGHTLSFGAVEPSCADDLVAVGSACDLTVADLLACAEVAAGATCDTDLSEEPCRALYQDGGCSAAQPVVTALLGGPFGLQDGMSLGLLTSSQVYAFCLETTDFAPLTVTCDGTEITIDPSSQQECVASLGATPPACPATLGQARACIEALFAGSCDALFGEAECAPLVDPACVP